MGTAIKSIMLCTEHYKKSVEDEIVTKVEKKIMKHIKKEMQEIKDNNEKTYIFKKGYVCFHKYCMCDRKK